MPSQALSRRLFQAAIAEAISHAYSSLQVMPHYMHEASPAYGVENIFGSRRPWAKLMVGLIGVGVLQGVFCPRTPDGLHWPKWFHLGHHICERRRTALVCGLVEVRVPSLHIL